MMPGSPIVPVGVEVEVEGLELRTEQPRWFDLPPVPAKRRPLQKPARTLTVTLSGWAVAEYPGLAEIPLAEWRDFFPESGHPWSREDRAYLMAWWGKDDILSLAYALGRPPWALQREVSRIRKHDPAAIPRQRPRQRPRT